MMERMRLHVVATPAAREAAVRRAILGNGTSQVRLTSGQRRALARVARALVVAVPSSGRGATTG